MRCCVYSCMILNVQWSESFQSQHSRLYSDRLTDQHCDGPHSHTVTDPHCDRPTQSHCDRPALWVCDSQFGSQKNLLPQFGSRLSTTFCNTTKVAQWAASSSSRPQPATDNGVRDDRFNWLTVTPHHLRGSNVLNATCAVQMRSTNYECSKRDANPVPSEHKAPRYLCGHPVHILYAFALQ